jgi:hypothetical protein
MIGDVQFQEGKVAIAVIGLVLALLGDIFLEGRGGLGVVSVEAVEDGLDVFRPVGRVVEGNHGVDVREERSLNKPTGLCRPNLTLLALAFSTLTLRHDLALSNPKIQRSRAIYANASTF